MCLRYFSWKNNKNIIWHNQIGRCYAKKINSGIVKNLTKFKAIYLDLGWYSWLKILVKIPYLPSKYSKKVLYLLVYQIVPSKYGKLLLHAMYHDTLVSPFFELLFRWSILINLFGGNLECLSSSPLTE